MFIKARLNNRDKKEKPRKRQKRKAMCLKDFSNHHHQLTTIAAFQASSKLERIESETSNQHCDRSENSAHQQNSGKTQCFAYFFENRCCGKMDAKGAACFKAVAKSRFEGNFVGNSE